MVVVKGAEALLRTVREVASSAVWNRGVELARQSTISVCGKDDSSLQLSVAGAYSSTVCTLWPEEENWGCNCGSDEDVCQHVVAAVLAIKNGDLKEEGVKGRQEQAGLSYRFYREGGTLAFERWITLGGESRALLTSLDKLDRRLSEELTPFLTKEDRSIEAALVFYGRQRVDRALATWLFTPLSSLSSVSLDDTPIRVSRTRVELKVRVSEGEQGFVVQCSSASPWEEIFSGGVVRSGAELSLIEEYNLSPEERAIIRGEKTLYHYRDAARLVSEILPSLRSKLEVTIEADTLPSIAEVKPTLRFKCETLPGDILWVLPQIVYGDPTLAVVKGDGELELFQRRTIPLRDREAERRLAKRVFVEHNMKVGQPSQFRGVDGVEMRKRLEGELLEGRKDDFTLLGQLTPTFSFDGTALTFEFTAKGKRINGASVLRAWERGEQIVSLPEGGWGTLPHDWLERFGARAGRLLSQQREKGSLPPSLINEVIELSGGSRDERLSDLKKRIEDTSVIPNSLPNDLSVELREYQKQGVSWLTTRRSFQMGALLADDMGLGKTLQALCTVKGRTLIIAPTSVLLSWKDQIGRYRPSLNISVFHGSDRVLDPDADIIITTYGVLRRDDGPLFEVEWDLVIVDEAQTIKNPDSQAARAAYALRAASRIALSGTPVENRLDDLWSIMHFLNPGVLGARDEFQREVVKPIQEGKGEVIEELRRRVKPFILRRLKRDVAEELPQKTEVVLHCDLSEEEWNVYQSIKAATKKELLSKLPEEVSTMAALEALLRLRQACCHPALVPGGAEGEGSSSKIELLLQTLDASLALGHKALIFSQWTSYLDLIEEAFKRNGLGYVRLDGATRDREGVVSAFQRDDGPPLMLISLKAGGVGITLTAADQIFLMDPWWNPAVEEQAADRAHRIGQKNPVLVHRLIARDTVEERLLMMQERKASVARSILEGAEEVRGLTKQELLELLT